MEKIILVNKLAPGDVCVSTAAVRSLQLNNPGLFQIDFRGTAPQLWNHNPHLTRIQDRDPEKRHLKLEYPLIQRSNQSMYHFLHGYCQFLEEHLRVDVPLIGNTPDIHLSGEEMSWTGQVEDIVKRDIPFWIIMAGGKHDYTIKHWVQPRWQEVVDRFKGKICFVQCGEAHKQHWHEDLEGVIDLRGKTDIRQFVRLMHHAQGVLCPVTFAMHLSAGTVTREGMPKHRPTVVVAGAREPVQWEAYPTHQYLHNVGALPCAEEACWKSRTVALNDAPPGGLSDKKDQSLCENTVERNGLIVPRCMDMISTDRVVDAIETYFEGGVVEYLSDEDYKATLPCLTQPKSDSTTESETVPTSPDS